MKVEMKTDSIYDLRFVLDEEHPYDANLEKGKTVLVVRLPSKMRTREVDRNIIAGKPTLILVKDFKVLDLKED